MPRLWFAWLPASLWPWSQAVAGAGAPTGGISVDVWGRGADVQPPAPITAACVLGVLVAYGIVAPAENEVRSHHALARELHRLVPPKIRTLNFFNEIDEGLWFYLSGIELAPVPGTHPRYNTAYDLAHSYLNERLPSETISHLEAKRQARDKHALIDWIDQSEPSSCYLLIRGSLYDGFAGELAGRVVPLFRETGMKRNELVLLRVTGRRPPSATASATPSPRR